MFNSLPQSYIMCNDGSIGKVSVHRNTGDGFQWPETYDQYLRRLELQRPLPILDRAWTHQELLLSPRVIRYLNNSIELCCLAGSFSHDGLRAPNKGYPRAPMRNPRLPPEFYGDCGTAPPTSHQDIKTLWYELVEQYSPAKTTVQCDKLLALAGIAEGFQRVTGDTYLAGLWKESLQNDLLWTSGLTSENAETFRTFRDRSIPTWSWAAWAGIKFMYPLNSPSDNWHLNAQFLEASVEILDEKLPFGRVAGGLLIIKGPLRVLSIGEVREPFKIDKRRWRGHEVYPDFD